MSTGFLGKIKGKYFLACGSLSQFGKALGAAFGFSGLISAQVSAAGVGNGADTTEDVLFTYTLPPNALDAPGRTLFIEAFGATAANANTKTVKLYFGATVLSTGAFTTSAAPWNLALTVQKTGANVQIVQGASVVGTTHQGVTNFAGAETDTGNIVIKVTGTSGTAAANNITANSMLVQAFN